MEKTTGDERPLLHVLVYTTPQGVINFSGTGDEQSYLVVIW